MYPDGGEEGVEKRKDKRLDERKVEALFLLSWVG